jgi:hypothetical protein
MADGGLEDRIRLKPQPPTVAELQNLPFANYREFQQAHSEGRALVWVRYDPAAILALGHPSEKVFHVLLAGSALWISLGVAAFAIAANHHFLWVVVPAALLGGFLAAPDANLAKGCLPIMLLLVGAVFSLVSDQLFWLPGAASVVAYFLTSIAQGIGDVALREAMLQSEVVFIWLYCRGTITSVQLAPSSEA